MPIEKLRAAAAARGIEVPARATRKQLASLLVIHTVRERTESGYRETGVAFDSKEAAYPHLRKLVKQHGLQRILDVGCGPGLFAEELVRTKALPAGGTYLGLDLAPSAIELARQRLAHDARFRFEVGDARELARHDGVDVDGIVISFVVTYLDTVTADRMFRELVRAYPTSTVIVALGFLACADRIEGVVADEQRELRAARRFLAGDSSAVTEIWDTRRWRCYLQSFETYYKIIDERVVAPQAQKLWVLRPRTAKSSGSKKLSKKLA